MKLVDDDADQLALGVAERRDDAVHAVVDIEIRRQDRDQAVRDIEQLARSAALQGNAGPSKITRS
jgi:hypothetical protein